MEGYELMSLKEKCAVMGVWNHPEASFLTYLGLYSLQHRGQEGAGIISLDKSQHIIHKNKGLVRDVFSNEALKKLTGSAAIGHTRYSTTGCDDVKNIQPLQKELSFGPIAISHNGNIVNYEIIKEEFKNNSCLSQDIDSDTECVFPFLEKYKNESLIEALQKSLSQVEGAFSFAILTKDSLIGARDPRGFRPLVLGKKDDTYILASETCAFDLIGAKYIREVEAGEIVVINKEGLKSYQLPPVKRKAHCIFEYVYFARPDSLVFGGNVYEKRKNLGRILARENPVKADFVIPVPDSGVPGAIGYAQESKLPFEMGIIRNHYIGRTFIYPASQSRDFKVKIKLNPHKILEGKKIVVVDDSIVRGTTSKSLIKILRQEGAKEIHLRITSPPIKGPCFYGVDTPQQKQLISKKYNNLKELTEFLEADSLAYLSQEGLLEASGKQEFCTACFDEKYPTPLYNKEIM